jgi:intergrase/recombinase
LKAVFFSEKPEEKMILVRSPGFEPEYPAWENDYGNFNNSNRFPRNTQSTIISYCNRLDLGLFGNSNVNSTSVAHGNRNCKVDWQSFALWLKRRGLSKKHRSSVLCYGKKWSHLLFSGQLSVIEGVAGQRHILMALANLSKFLGCYGWFRKIKEDSGLHWGRKSSSSIFEKIYGQETEGIVDWLKDCERVLSYEDYFALKWLAISGLRTGEGYKSLELVKKEGLERYLNKEILVLEHFRYPNLFMRRTKNCYLSVVDEEILDELQDYRGKTKYWKLRKTLRRHGIEVRTYDLRKEWATFMVMNGIPESVVDLCQGRLGTSIFQQSYFRPNMLELVEKVRKVLKKYMKMLEI